MASSSPKLMMSILFLFAFFSMQIQAREFFSKIPSVNNNEKETFIPENQKTSSLPNKEEVSFEKQEQEPRFVPETQNGYGLYGHESGQLSSNTKQTYEPYVTPVRYHPDEPYNSIPAANNNNNNNNNNAYFYSKNNAYETEQQQNLGEARFTERGWSTKENQNTNNKNAYETEQQKHLGEARFTERGWSNKENQNNNNNNYYSSNSNNVERKGMSDTRFLENGKYYYDVKNENNYYPNQFESSRGVGSRNEVYNENIRYNNMGRFNQNQEDQFEENEEEEFEP